MLLDLSALGYESHTNELLLRKCISGRYPKNIYAVLPREFCSIVWMIRSGRVDFQVSKVFTTQILLSFVIIFLTTSLSAFPKTLHGHRSGFSGMQVSKSLSEDSGYYYLTLSTTQSVSLEIRVPIAFLESHILRCLASALHVTEDVDIFGIFFLFSLKLLL